MMNEKRERNMKFNYLVKINYGGNETAQAYKTLKQAKKRWASWYYHGLDVGGQISSTLDIVDMNSGECVFSDCYQ